MRLRCGTGRRSAHSPTSGGRSQLLVGSKSCGLPPSAERIEVLLDLGDTAGAVADSELLLASDPLKESSVALRMRALHAAGRSADALRAATAFRRRLSEQAGLSASPGLDELERQILEHDPAAALPTTRRALRGYVFGDLIAEGAHGAVYAATQPNLGRDVAIKVLRKSRADSAEFIRRFEAEAQLVAKLEHPAIVPLYDYWREPGNAYLVLRLLRGGSLADRIARRERIPLEDVDLLIERVGDALHAAHTRGVVHRDVRAANVLYDDGGRPYLADFGIALANGTADDATDDIAALAATLQPLVGGDSSLAPQRSILRRAATGEIASAREFVMAWRSSRELVTPTPSPDRPFRSPAVVVNPYVGLRFFGEADAALFHGRGTVVDEIAAMLQTRTFLAVVGPSGAGKSSVVRAGVVPRLREHSYVVTMMTPGTRPLYSLGVALRRVATQAQLAGAGEEPGALLDAVAGAQPTVLVVDQLEELWTQSIPDDRTQFVRLLDSAMSLHQLRVLATIRADFFDRPLGEPTLAAHVKQGSYPLTALSPANSKRRSPSRWYRPAWAPSMGSSPRSSPTSPGSPRRYRMSNSPWRRCSTAETVMHSPWRPIDRSAAWLERSPQPPNSNTSSSPRSSNSSAASSSPTFSAPARLRATTRVAEHRKPSWRTSTPK